MPNTTTLTRRTALAVAAWLLPCAPALAHANLHALLATHLPPGLNPRSLGRALAGDTSATTCLAHAGAPSAITAEWLAQATADDFAAGRTIVIQGWQLSRTEAWLCAAVA